MSPVESKLSSVTIGRLETAAERGNGLLQVVEVGERLDEEELDAAALEDARLLGIVAARADRACDEHLFAGNLARLASELDRGFVDPVELVLEEVPG